MTYDPNLIAPFGSGLSKYYKPFLIGNDAFVELDNAYQQRGYVKKREGSNILATLPLWGTGATISDTTPPVVTLANHGLFTNDMVFLSNVLSFTISSLTVGVITTITTSAPHGLSSFEEVTISGIVGSVGNILNGHSYLVTVTGASSFTINAYTLGSVYTSGGIGVLTALQDQTFVITKLSANTFALRNLTTAVNIPASGTATGVTIALPIVGTRTYIDTATADEQLIVFNPRKAYLYNAGAVTDISFFVNSTITAITAGNPTVITLNSHGMHTGDTIIITGVTGTMSTVLNGILFIVTVIDPNSFSIPVDTTTLTYINGGTVSVLWTGTKDDFFYTSNYATVMWTTNNVDFLRFYNGSSTNGWADQVPALNQAGTTLQRTLLVLPYKGRLVLLSPTENTGGNNQTFFQRARFSQNGTPFYENAPAGFSNDPNSWLDDLPGRGGYIDADTSERIVSAEIIQDVMIVSFQFSTWRLRYTGNEVLPFVWERINTQFGSEATFSDVPFDDHKLTISRRGLVAASFNDVLRADLLIPDYVTEVQPSMTGEILGHIQGVRDYEKRLVYWIYPEINHQTPNKILCYNYQDKTWATFTQSFTVLGRYKITADNVWQTWTTPWEGDTSTWQDPFDNINLIITVAGDVQGNIWQIMNEAVSTDNGQNYNFTILTNVINPYFSNGTRCKLAFYDLYVTSTDVGEITLENFTDDNNTRPWLTKKVNTKNETDLVKYVRVFLGIIARNHQIKLTLSPEQLADPEIGATGFQLQGVIFHTRSEGRIKR